ncbi:addiction module antidote protein [Pseudomonas alliivorans]|nr:addiction module antidote protein [Pseudomonas alliivorans]
MKDRSHDEVMAEVLRADPLYVRTLLNEVLRGGDTDELAILLRQIQQSDSGILTADARVVDREWD